MKNLKRLYTILFLLICFFNYAQTWQTVGKGIGMNASVSALLSDSTSNTLIAAGEFTVADVIPSQNMISWDGNEFHQMPITPNSSPLCMLRDTVNNLLYVSGNFSNIGNSSIMGIAVWNGETWSQLAAWAGGFQSMCMYNGELYVAASSTVKKWNGSSFVNVGINVPSGAISDLVVFQGSLYACGVFQKLSPNQTPAKGIAKFDGNDWSPVGYNFTLGVSYGRNLVANESQLFYYADGKVSSYDGNTWAQISQNTGLATMEIYNGDLYVGGIFYSFENVAATSGIAKWDGQNWVPVGTGILGASGVTVNDLCVYNGELYAGGCFTSAGGVSANNIAKWNGINWTSLSTGLTPTDDNLNGVMCLAEFNCQLMIGGFITGTKGTTVNRIAKYDGSNWSTLGGGANNIVCALTKWNGNIYVGGNFSSIGNVAANKIAVWNGTNYSALGNGTDGIIYTMAVYNGELYVGGYFQTAGTTTSPYIAKWNGVMWDTVGAGLNDVVYALTVYNGELYAGGVFSASGSQTMNNISKWNGSVWMPVANGTNDDVLSLSVHNNNLYVGGDFSMPGNKIAKWDGISWSTLGTGMNFRVCALSSINGQLYSGGSFTSAGGNTQCKKIARWNGSSWQSLALGMNNGKVNAIASHNNSIFIGGTFTQAAVNQPRSYIAKWETVQLPTADFNDCNGDICENGCKIFTDISLNSPTTFKWSFPGGTPSISSLASPRVCYNSPGTYSVTLIASNAVGSDTVVKYTTIFPLPATPVITSLGLGANLMSSSATGNQWYFNSYPIVGSIYQAHMPMQYGNYSVSVTDTNNCISMSQPFNYGLGTSITEIGKSVNFSIDPVPSSDKITINAGPFIEAVSRLTIFDVLGKEIISREFDPVKYLSIDISIDGMESGVYFVFIKNGQNMSAKKFIKN